MRARACLLALTATAALAIPATAVAKRGYFVEPASVGVKLVLHGSHGYRVSIRNFGHRFILLSASKEGASASYAVRGHATRSGIYANLGRLGRIAVKFEGSKRPLRRNRHPIFRCKGDPPIHEVGRFTGTVRFDGELGFTSVSAKRVRGSVVRRSRQVCKQPSRQGTDSASASGRKRSEKPSFTVFAEASRTTNKTIFVETVGAELPGRSGRNGISFALAFAGLQERRGRIAISRTAFIEASTGDVLAGDDALEPTSGTIALPRPFSGTAAYSKPAGAKASLTGSLGIRLPGTDRLPLTGPDFKAALCRTLSKKRLNRCLREVAGELGSELAGVVSARPQGSGSQSQAFWDARLSWSR